MTEEAKFLSELILTQYSPKQMSDLLATVVVECGITIETLEDIGQDLE